MHNHYYFLRQLSRRLQERLTGFTLVSCFSQEKDELVMEFNDAKESFFLKCSLLSDIQCLSFPESFRRARKNSVDLFQDVLMKHVTGVRQFNNERSFGLEFDKGFLLVFKMHGLQANVILFKNEQVVEVFRHHLPADRKLEPHQLDREIDWSEQAFRADPGKAKSTYATFGNAVWHYLDENGFQQADIEVQVKMIADVRALLEEPRFRLVDYPGRLKLSLLPGGNILEEFDDPIVAVNTFFLRFVSRSAFDREKAALLASIRGRMKQGAAYLEKTQQRLAELEADQHYTSWADLVMANLHRISPEMSEVILEDFHEPGRQVTIKLKKGLSPQKNAEVFYRKAKNQAIEKKKLEETKAAKEKELNAWSQQEQVVVQANTREQLQPIARLFQTQKAEKEKRATVPYHQHEFSGFMILVGKNAAANDDLTLHYTHKEDLWLHAKDVAGSHVVVKHQAGKKFPKDVIAFAASLAAYHSKRRTESLVPVTVTPAKYVRKRKGDPPGMVVVQREEVVMAEPGEGVRGPGSRG